MLVRILRSGVGRVDRILPVLGKRRAWGEFLWILFLWIYAVAMASAVTFAVTGSVDAAMIALGAIPIVGDLVSSAYFVGKDYLACMEGKGVEGGCDPLTIGLDALGFLPLVPSLGAAAHLGKAGKATSRVDDIFANPSILRSIPGKVKTPADLPGLIADAQGKGWRVTTLGEGSQKGAGLRLLGPDGATIRFNPGGTRHTGPYWYVASGQTGRYWVHPWWSVGVGRRG